MDSSMTGNAYDNQILSRIVPGVTTKLSVMDL